MKRIGKLLILTAVIVSLSPLARAAYNNNDLILGFEDATLNIGTQTYTGPNDYVIDFGNASTVVGVGGGAVVNLTSDFSLTTFNGLYGSLSGGVSMGVVGGTPTGVSSRTIFLTVQRDLLGDPTVAGSTTPATVNPTSDAGAIGSVGNMINNLSLSPSGSTTVSPGSSSSWTQRVAPNQTLTPLPTLLSATGRNPMGSVSSGSVIYEDLYQSSSSSGAFTYRGFFKLDTSDPVNTLTFTPVGVPEPGSLAILALGGLGVFATRYYRRRG